MLSVRVSRDFRLDGSQNLDAVIDILMEELLRLESVSILDSEITAELASWLLRISLIAKAETFDEAVSLGDAAIRTAIHASGGQTPGWENTIFEATRADAELLSA